MKLGRVLLLVACATGCQEKQTAPAQPAPSVPGPSVPGPSVPAARATTAATTPGPAGSAECGRIVAQLRRVAARQLPPVLDPRSQILLGNATAEVRRSCEDDGWSDELKQCALELTDLTDALATCRAHIPPALHAKLAARMAKLMAR